MSSAQIDTAADIHLLYRQHHGWLQGLLRKRLGNLYDAADLAQDVFLRLLIKPRQFDSHAGARAYLSVMAQGMCVDLWRRREIERAWLNSLAARPEPVVLSAEHSNIILETLYQVDAMLRALPEKVRAAFVMAQIQGLTYREIASVLSVSERMVKKYMAQAMLHCVLLEAEIEETTLACQKTAT
ncbi:MULTISPECIES: sigma-70 family RNA polymerase sigma factor [unclassified Brenneria]|uniref:sigma-70 family RNA polymerase sigma factor n=1 Tax=unclassified Brenneria TaxID=2634434 RepID=UPI001554F683|nr:MULTISPECIES: sigma-70 family RNA polymerase sigma factor [unclassified Brenneria]MBJ7222621.1 sigma-70 family RNA polymerase sigma factor [Brenneria sp. L3-3C-1]MEE3643864.1 sigma-70 family RNA polymerase sigma factor [Brenneria sp. L3_3C_1]MEE3651183.1 sigma-70 family RNA polymerase sigma factor [Brenneria sp. HEZEL_4_2_4]NPD01138.1 sigma-70 family RNA polymerase sigma factor [Brenneria sp. hezel4-2-4]